MVDAVDIKKWIEEGLPGSQVEVSGDGHHFDATVISPHFVDKTAIEQHRMVYDALGDKMTHVIHALSLKTLTPEEMPDEDE